MALSFINQKAIYNRLINGISNSLVSGMSNFKRKPQLLPLPYRAHFETIEPRILLSADLLPGAEEAAEDGIELLADRISDFLNGESLLEQRVPFLLAERELDGQTVNEAPTVNELLGLPVDANGIGGVSGVEELELESWDTNADGFVSADELLNNLLFMPMQTLLFDATGADGSQDFIDNLVDDLDLVNKSYGGGYVVDFNVINADTLNLTEEIDSEVSWQLSFELTVSQTMPIDLGLDADDLQLHAFTGLASNPTPPVVPLDAKLSFAFEFGVLTSGKADGDLTSDDFFIRSADDLLISVTSSDADMDFNLNIGFLGAEVIDGSLELQLDVEGNLEDPNSPAVLGFVGGHFDDIDSQYGDEQSDGEVVANEEFLSVDLAHDAGFFIRIGYIGISSDVLVIDDNNNISEADLLTDINSALAIAGLDQLVEASIVSDKVQFNLVSTDVTPLGFDVESLGIDGGVTAAAAPADFEPTSTVNFLLSLGGAIPSMVSVRYPDPAQTEIGFDGSEITSLAPIVSQNVSTGADFGGIDTPATFTIKIYRDAGSDITKVIEVRENLVAPVDPADVATFADLLLDLKAALTAQGVGPALIGVTESGGKFTFTTNDSDISAIEISATDSVARDHLGLVNGQSTYLTMTAAAVIGNVTFDDLKANTDDDAHFVVTVNGVEHDITVIADGARTTHAELAAAIDTALSSAGLAISASDSGGSIVLNADNATIRSISVSTENQDLDDLLDDLNRALTAGGIADVSAIEDSGNIKLLATGGSAGSSLEITNTLTLDAGVTGAELDDDEVIPDATLSAAPGEDSNITFNLPVEVLPGLLEHGLTTDWAPADLVIQGNFNPFGILGEFDTRTGSGTDLDPYIGTNRFNLDFSVNPVDAESPAIAVPNPIADESLTLVNFAEVLQFNKIGPSSIIGMLSELGAAMDSIMQSGEFSQYNIPFTQASLADTTAFEDLLYDALIYDFGADELFDEEGALVDDSNRLLIRSPLPGAQDEDGDTVGDKFGLFPSYATAQELGARLSELLLHPRLEVVDFENAGAINPTYDPSTNYLTYDLDLISSDEVSVGINEAFTPEFAFNVDLDPFNEFVLTPVGVNGTLQEELLVTIGARTVLATTVGFDLSPTIPLEPAIPAIIDDPETLDVDESWPGRPAEQDTTDKRFFVKDGSFGSAFTVDLPIGGVSGSALMGIVGVDVSVDGRFGAQFSSQFQAEEGIPGSLLYLDDMQRDIQETRDHQVGGLAVVTDPVVSKLQTLNYSEDGDYADPVEGSRIVSESGGTAYVLENNATDGILTLFNAQGDFVDTEFFIDVQEIGEGTPAVGGIANGTLTTQDYFGTLTMDVAVQDGFNEAGFGDGIIAALDGMSGPITLNMTDFGDPNATPEPFSTVVTQAGLAGIGDLADFEELSYQSLIDALEGLGELIDKLEANYELLLIPLPIVNRSVSELLGLREGVDRAIASAKQTLQEQSELLAEGVVDVPTLDLQGMAISLWGAFGLPEGDAGLVIDVLEDDNDGKKYLTLDFDIEKTISTTLGLDMDLGENLPNLTSGRILRADGSLGWGFKIGINLDDTSDVQLFNPEGGITGNLHIFGEGAEGFGQAFLAQVGEMPVQVMDALMDIELDFDLNIDAFGKKSLDLVIADLPNTPGLLFDDFTSTINEQSFDISVPLFDVDGGLTGFVGEISGVGTELLFDGLGLANDFELPNLTELEGLVSDYVINLEEFSALDNLLLLTDTADFFFEAIQGLLDKATSIEIPLVGDNLADGARFIEDFRDTFIAKFRAMVENATNVTSADVADFLEEFFNDIGLNLLGDITAVEDWVGGELVDVQWMLSLGRSYDTAFDIGFDVGVPLLGMDLDIPIELEIDWSLEVGLGVNDSVGAYIILNDDASKELNIDLTIALPENELFRGELGFLEVIVDNNGSGLSFEFDIDLSNTSGGNIIGINDLGNIGFSTMIGGSALYSHLLDLELAVGINGADVIFPKILTNFIMDWDLGSTPLLDEDFNAVGAGLQLIDFRDVQVDLASFLDGFLGDVLAKIKEFTDPLSPITDFLEAEVPILTQLAAIVGEEPVTILDLAELLGVADVEFLDWLLEIVGPGGVIDQISALDIGDGDQLLLSIGELEVFEAPSFDDGDLVSGIADLAGDLFNVDADISKLVTEIGGGFDGLLTTLEGLGAAFGNLGDAMADGLETVGDPGATISTITNLDIGEPGSLFSFPILENPSSVLGMLVGQNVSLVEVDIPALGVGFDYEQFFTIFGPLGASVGAGFYVGVDLSFGFDTYGIARYAKSDFTNPGLIFDGFFFGDRDGITTGIDIPELLFEFDITGTAEINLGIARGGVGGGITARIFLDWNDPNNDGAVHISEIINNIEDAARNGDNVLLSPFDVGGDLSARFFAFLIIDLGIKELKYFFDILPSTEILDFEYSFARTPILATDMENGTLQLNIGPNAIDRLNGDTRDGDEAFEVKLEGGEVKVKSAALGTDWQNYGPGFTHIVGLGGQGNDSMEFSGFDASTITFNLQGGVGDDTIKFIEDAGVVAPAMGAGAIIKGDRGNDTLIGGHLNDIIYGGQGNDHIEGGRGYDILFGDEGTLQSLGGGSGESIGTRITGLDGNDVIYGGSQTLALAEADVDDIVFGGGGSDELHGDAGQDILIGDAGRFNFSLTDGHVDMTAFTADISSFTPNSQTDPNPVESTDAKIQKILLDIKGKFSGTDIFGGGNDEIFGGAGKDLILGGSANDTIDAGADNDYVIGGKGFDQIDGGLGDDSLFGNAQDDIINGNEGDDIISGGFGDDTLHGNENADFMVGGRGRDIMYGDAGNDELHGQGEPDIMFGGTQDDLVVGGVGADILLGDDGQVVKFGETELDPDLIVGNGAQDISLFEGRADSIVGSLDLIITDAVAGDGNDIISGGEGGDIILGGGGKDLAGGDVDPRIAQANEDFDDNIITTPVGNDIIIGDAGLVEFNQRRLQLVEGFADGDVANADARDTLFGDNGDDVIIGGQGSDGNNNGTDGTKNVMDKEFMLAGGHGPGRGATDDGVSDKDIILGDNGKLVYVASVDKDGFDDPNFGKLSYVQTTDTSNDFGGADTAYGQLDNDIIFGGVNSSVDVLMGSLGQDVILGDNGLIHFNYDWMSDDDRSDFDSIDDIGDFDVTTIDLIRSFTDGWGGIDIISGDADADVLIGGEAGDIIYGDNATASAGIADLGDVILGDNGDIFLEGDTGRLMVMGTAIDYITTTDEAEDTGGADTISGNAGADVILGGVNYDENELNNEGVDTLYGDAASQGNGDLDDLMLGDNGILLFNYDWRADLTPDDDDYSPLEVLPDEVGDGRLTLDMVRSFTDGRGGVDIISGDVGGDMILGGSDADIIYGYNAAAAAGALDLDDILFGDNGDVLLTGTVGERILLGTAVARIFTTDELETTGGADVIEGNAGDDVIVGGVNNAGIDILHGDAAALDSNDGDDILLGDQAILRWDVTVDEALIEVVPGTLAVGDGDTDDIGDQTTLDLIQTYNTGSQGGVDHIYANDGSDVAMGGSAGDEIYGDFYYDGVLHSAGNPGQDVLLGDGGEITFINAKVTVIRTIEPGEGGADFIRGNDFGDTLLGGFAGDELYGEAMAENLGLVRSLEDESRAGDDWILGDNGRLDFILASDNLLGREDVGDSVDLDSNSDNLDRVMTTDPTLGGDDVIYGNGNSGEGTSDIIFGGTGSDTVRGDTSDTGPGDDGSDGKDLIFGDHGKLYPTLPTVDNFFINNNFFSIDTQLADLGAGDILYGNANDDIMIGGQGDDVMFGGTGDDDMIGGHNVAGGDDDLDAMPGADQLSISPGTVLANLNPSDVNEINDIMDGGAGDDVMAGDSAIIVRQPNYVSGGALDNNALASPRFRMLGLDGQLYNLLSAPVQGLADIDVGFAANVTGVFQDHQDMTLVRTVTLLDHSESIEDDAVANNTDPRPFGNDIMVGGSEDDEMWGQLGDDIIQGDGEILVTSPAFAEVDFRPYDPSQGAEPDFDLRNFTIRFDLMAANDLAATLSFNVFEALTDGDDYIEGNGGNDRMYGNLGQDDLIGGSSTLFGLGDDDATFHGESSGNALRPDGADLIYGGAGEVSLLARNAEVSGANTLVPDAERHATDADTILGDNGDIFRIVEDIDSEADGVQLGYATFNYDYDSTTADGFVDHGYGVANDALQIRVRAITFADYGYYYVDHDTNADTREVLQFLSTARGAGDLIYGESGDDVIHGMTGDDTIFGNSEHDDIYGEIGADFLLGGTGIDGILGDDGLILTSRNDINDEVLNGIAGLNEEQVFNKKNDEVDIHAINAVISTPGNIQVAMINIANELVKAVELFAFRTDDIDIDGLSPTNEFGEAMRFNDIIFGGLQNDFIHGGDGDDALSGAEALPTYYAGYSSEDFSVVLNEEFTTVNTFLQNMQSSPANGTPDIANNPFWFAFAPYNPGDILRFEGKAISDENGQGSRTRNEFAWYDEFAPRTKIMFDFEHDFGADAHGLTALTTLTDVDNPIDFILNFDESEGPLGPTFDGDDAPLPSDGADRIFGDLGNDWQVGGTGRDHMYGGRGDDLLNMDDNHDSGAGGKVGPHDPVPDPLDNTNSDEYQAYADIVYAGAGRDVMILNTGADRAIDWVGEYNSYIVPFSPFGAFHISRTLQPQVPEYLFALSGSDGVDNRFNSLALNNALDGQLFVDQKNLDVRTDDPEAMRNHEPYGELGMVRQTDYDWQEQTGAPNDPQPGNLQGKREIMRRELFSNAEAFAFAADVGNFVVANGVMTATPDFLGDETVSLFHLDQMQPSYMEILATINAEKDKAGVKSNAYIIFDYQGADDFKFAGVDVGTDKIQIGHRDASGWVIDSQIQMRLKAGNDYDLTLVLFNSVATIYVNERLNLSLDFGEPLNDGGMVGVGTDNAIASFDDFQVQQLPPVWTFENTSDFSGTSHDFNERSGDWQQTAGELEGSVNNSLPAIATQYLDLAAYSRLELVTNLQTSGQGGFVFDYYSDQDFKYVTLDAATDQVIIGHYTSHGWSIDATADFNVNANKGHELTLTIFGTTASVLVDGDAVLAYVFNGLLNDGDYGLLVNDGSASFDDFLVRGDDPAYGQALFAETAPASNSHESLVQISDEQLTKHLASAALNWGDQIDQLALADIEIRFADLDGLMLGQLVQQVLTLDIDAAGHGWFIDTTPAINEEFDEQGQAIDSDIANQIDLLTVISHELGHYSHMMHTDDGLMAETLAAGTRVLPDGFINDTSLSTIANFQPIFIPSTKSYLTENNSTEVQQPVEFDANGEQWLVYGIEQEELEPQGLVAAIPDESTASEDVWLEVSSAEKLDEIDALVAW